MPSGDPRRLAGRAALLATLLLPTACAAPGGVPLECAPYARSLTGLALRGDADAWWSEAGGRYARADRPERGAVLVFRRSAQLPHGHVAVVARVLGRRSILVAQANWVHHRTATGDAVVDVSARNDWSRVRVWWAPAGRMGAAVYDTYGFILPGAV